MNPLNPPAPPPRRLVSVNVPLSEDSTWEFLSSRFAIVPFLDRLSGILGQVPTKYRKEAYFIVEGAAVVSWSVAYDRPETDDEYEARLKCERRDEEDARAYRRSLYETLKAEFEVDDPIMAQHLREGGSPAS